MTFQKFFAATAGGMNEREPGSPLSHAYAPQAPHSGTPSEVVFSGFPVTSVVNPSGYGIVGRGKPSGPSIV